MVFLAITPNGLKVALREAARSGSAVCYRAPWRSRRSYPCGWHHGGADCAARHPDSVGAIRALRYGSDRDLASG